MHRLFLADERIQVFGLSYFFFFFFWWKGPRERRGANEGELLDSLSLNLLFRNGGVLGRSQVTV